MTGGEMSFDESIDCSVTGLAAKKKALKSLGIPGIY